MKVKDAYRDALSRMQQLGWRIDRAWFDDCPTNISQVREELDKLEAEIEKLNHP